MNCPLCTSDRFSILKHTSTDVYVCNDCTLQYIDDRELDKNRFSNFFAKFRANNSESDKLRQIQYDIDAQHIQRYLPNGKILDVGCSSGDFIARLRGSSNFQLFGIDLDTSAIKVAKKKYGNGIKFENCNLIKFDTNNRFDCIIFRGSFQYLGSEVRQTLERISEIIKKKGKLLIYSLPNSDSFVYHLLGDNWHLFNKVEHTLIFNRRSILKMCEIFQYKLIELSYPYLETPYANPEKDYENLISLVRKGQNHSFPFWGNVMQVVLEKL